MVMVNFMVTLLHGGYTCFMIDFMLCTVQIIVFLTLSVKFLSMTFILLGFGKVGFCEMFAKRGTLQRSGREVLREDIFENKNVIFHINYATH